MILVPQKKQKTLLIMDNGSSYCFHLAIQYLNEDFEDLIKMQKNPSFSVALGLAKSIKVIKSYLKFFDWRFMRFIQTFWSYLMDNLYHKL